MRLWIFDGTGTKEPTIGTLERLLEAFNAHDLDEVTSCFVDDCVLETCADRTRGGVGSKAETVPAKDSRADSPASPTSTTATTATGSAEARDAPSGSSPA
jgi:hypothetical protein